MRCEQREVSGMCADVEEGAAARKQGAGPLRHVAREAAHEDLPVNRVRQIHRHPVATDNGHVPRSLMGRDRIEQETLPFHLQRTPNSDHAFENRHRAPPVRATRDRAGGASRYASRQQSTVWVQVNFANTRRRPASPMLAASAGWARSHESRSPILAGSLGGTTKPLTPCSTISGMLATFVQIAGAPHAMPSSSVCPSNSGTTVSYPSSVR